MQKIEEKCSNIGEEKEDIVDTDIEEMVQMEREGLSRKMGHVDPDNHPHDIIMRFLHGCHGVTSGKGAMSDFDANFARNVMRDRTRSIFSPRLLYTSFFLAMILSLAQAW